MYDFEENTESRRTKVGPSAKVDQIATAVIGAAILVHRELGPGYAESTYENALAIELEHRAIPFERQVRIDIAYRGVIVGDHRLDLLVEGCLVVELKAVESLSSAHLAQVLAYLKSTSLQLGLILNFGRATLREGIRRVAGPSVFDKALAAGLAPL